METPAASGGNFPAIIQTVNTPLALAALALLVVGSVIYANSKSPNGSLIRYGFLLAGVFGVLAIGAFIWQDQNQGVRIARGSVFTDKGLPVEGAIVDLSGVGRTATLEDGSFRMPLERQDERPSYTIEIYKAGYQPFRQDSVAGPVPENKRYLVERSVIDQSSISLNKQVGVGVYAGAPELMLEFSVNNTTDTDQTGTASISLTSPSNRVLRLFPGYRLQDNMMMPAQRLSIPRLERETYQLGWNDGSQINSAMQGVSAALSRSQNGMCNPSTLSNATIEGLRDVFDENFLWEAGNWEGTLTLRTQQNTLDLPLQFSLSDADVKALRSVREAMRNCFGLFFGSHQFSMGPARSSVLTNLR